jgi:hypothetical protein
MQVDFLVEEEWSMALVRRVHHAYRKSGNHDDHVFYRGLHWRIVSEREVRGQIFGVRIKTVPRVLLPYDYEIFLYDYLVNSRFIPGSYEHGSAVANLTPEPGSKPLFRLKITGETLADVNTLYELITQHAIEPFIR